MSHIKQYDHEYKSNMADSISSITNKTILLSIREIIERHNPNNKPSVNSHGTYYHFDNLTSTTYQEIEKILEKYATYNKNNNSD